LRAGIFTFDLSRYPLPGRQPDHDRSPLRALRPATDASTPSDCSRPSMRPTSIRGP